MATNYCLQWQPNDVCNGNRLLFAIATKRCMQWQPNIVKNGNQLLSAIATKWCMQWQSNILCNENQILSAMANNYCLHCWPNIVCNGTQILSKMATKYYLQWQPNIVCNGNQTFPQRQLNIVLHKEELTSQSWVLHRICFGQTLALELRFSAVLFSWIWFKVLSPASAQHSEDLYLAIFTSTVYMFWPGF